MMNEIEVVVPIETDDITEEKTTTADGAASGGGDESPRPDVTDEAANEAAPGAVTECGDDATEFAAVATAEGDTRRGASWTRVLAFGVLPALALLFAMAVGYAKWQDSTMRDAQIARVESMQAAKDSTIALLSYTPENVEHDLNAARDRLTGSFRDSYSDLIHDVVIPGAKQKQISAVVGVPGVASVSASAGHAIVLVFVNQTIIVGDDPPSANASSVKVSMDKIGGRWLISDFTPV